MHIFCRKHPFGWWLLAAAMALILLVMRPQSAHAQPPTCNDAVVQLDNSLAPGVCDVLGLGNACLATRSVTATPRTGAIRFTAPGDQAQLNNIRQMLTVPQKGAAVLLGGSTTNPVKILVFGDTATAPNGGQSGRVFTVRASNGQPTCERTRSGMILQTPNGQRGTIVINGVTIQLGSTVYVVPGADLLFDQDPRIDRRQGSRNRNAPLCSGFDSDCDFGDEQCSRSDRLVWGPFCREDSYQYIEPGLYRVTLYGEGEVQAGATDYGISRDYELMGTQRLTLPGSYTFCWDGLQRGGSGFETVVQARSDGAYVDHITLEFLGQDCSLRQADNPKAGKGAGEMGVMTVYNVEGNVGVFMDDGEQGFPDSSQRLRIYYQGNQAVAMDNSPTDAPYIMDSELVQWASGATGGGLPEIKIGDDYSSAPSPTPSPTPPSRLSNVEVNIDAQVLYDGDLPYALRIEAQAYDPNTGSSNGDGINYVHFSISDPNGQEIYEKDESTAPYCAFGGNDSPCSEQSITASDSGGEWYSGTYAVTATAYTRGGRQASTTSYFRLEFPSRTEDSTPPVIESLSSDPAEVYCRGGDLVIGAQVSDDTGVQEVTLWWRAFSDDVDIPDFEALSMRGRTGFYQADLSGTDAATVQFYVTAGDEAGNEAESSRQSITGNFCHSTG